MKKRNIIAVIIVPIALLLSIVIAEAVEFRGTSASPSLAFVGTTAHCGADCTANTTADKVTIWLLLYEDGEYKTTWTARGNGYAIIDETYPATSGKTYTLTLSCSVNGVSAPAISVSDTCP